MSEHIKVEKNGAIGTISFNRPEKLNALTIEMFDAIIAAAQAFEKDESIRVVIMKGEGTAFCAGMDLANFSLDGTSEIMAQPLANRTHGIANKWQKAAWAWRELSVPVIAAVHGVAFGGGLQIMLGADIKFVKGDTKLSILEMKWGLIPDMAGSQLMRHNIREDIIKELTFTHRVFNGEEAVNYGFATHVSDDPYGDALALAKEIAGKSPSGIVKAKKLLNEAPYLSAASGLLLESTEQDQIIQKHNQLEAIFSNMQKRPGNFKPFREE